MLHNILGVISNSKLMSSDCVLQPLQGCFLRRCHYWFFCISVLYHILIPFHLSWKQRWVNKFSDKIILCVKLEISVNISLFTFQDIYSSLKELKYLHIFLYPYNAEPCMHNYIKSDITLLSTRFLYLNPKFCFTNNQNPRKSISDKGVRSMHIELLLLRENSFMI